MAIDRRIRRTRAMLHEAFMSLLAKKTYDAITVKDICEAADVGKSTFYAHYTGKDDLKRSGLEAMRKALRDRHRQAMASAEGGRDPRSLAFSLMMFEHANERIGHYRALIGSRGGAIALGMVRDVVSELVRDELAASAADGAEDGAPRELVVQYAVGAYMAMLTWWLDRGAKLAPQRMDAIFRRLATEGIVPRHG